MNAAAIAASSPQTSQVDVIVGAGPSGLMLGAVDGQAGHQDSRGRRVRTLEILDSFGIGERVWKEANHMLGTKAAPLRIPLTCTRGERVLTRLASEVSFWNPEENGRIRRSARVPDTMPGLSRFTLS
ncbi:Phenol 2-monooxygenase [Tolypocladium paradoxum]|uniref:Phenol 2-monooxygenase n=1 Tax=Tolypocladium paradoxum TaxID=94208 RepID=A0A2S4KPC1_9HYPO|nr:Phenol 2-monooxygenase [Tolypocladium paradoxum]